MSKKETQDHQSSLQRSPSQTDLSNSKPSKASKTSQPSSDVLRSGGPGPFNTFIQKNKVEAGFVKKALPVLWASAVKTAFNSVSAFTYVSGFVSIASIGVGHSSQPF